MPKKKISIVGPTYPYRGGIAHYTTLLTQHLRRRHDVRLYSYTRQYPRWLFPGRTDRDPSQHPLRVECEYLLDPVNPVTWWRLVQRIRQDPPALLILQWWVPYWAPSLAVISTLVKVFTATKLLYICHNVLPHEGRQGVNRMLVPLALRRGDAFIVHATSDREWLERLLPGATVYRADLPSCATFGEHDLSPAEAKARLGVGQHTALFFGFVRPYKGVDVLIEALALARRWLDIDLLIVGEFWIDEAALRRRIATRGLTACVHIVNRYVPDEEIGLYFAAADVVVLPYVEATQSAVTQLAFGFGRPVITTNVGGLAEVVQDGVTGLIVPPQDAVALSEAMLYYFQNDLKAAMVKNIAAQQDRFAWHAMVALIDSIAGS